MLSLYSKYLTIMLKENKKSFKAELKISKDPLTILAGREVSTGFAYLFLPATLLKAGEMQSYLKMN